MEAFVGEDIMVMHTMLINKPPDTGYCLSSCIYSVHSLIYLLVFANSEDVSGS